MNAKILPHEYVEQIRRNADDIQAGKLSFMPRTYAEVLKGKPREIAMSKQGEIPVMMTPQTVNDKAKEDDASSSESETSSDSSVSESSIDEKLPAKDKKRKANRQKKRKNARDKLKKQLKEANSMMKLTMLAKEDEEDEARELEISTSARAELTFTPKPKAIEAKMSRKEKLKLADQTKKHLDETTGLARINNALIGALSTEFGLTMTNKTKIDSTKDDYGIALFWYMVINHVEKFGRAQYDNIQKQMLEPDDKHKIPQGIILWLDRHFKAFEVAGEPIATAEKTRIFLRMIENQLGKDMLTYVRRLPHDFRIGDKNPDYEAYTKAIIQHVEEELDFPATPTKRIQLMTAEGEPTIASPEERIKALEEKLAKLSKPPPGANKGREKDKDGKPFVKWGLQRLQAPGDPPGIWAPDAGCAYHLYVEGKEISKSVKHYHTNSRCKVQKGEKKE